MQSDAECDLPIDQPTEEGEEEQEGGGGEDEEVNEEEEGMGGMGEGEQGEEEEQSEAAMFFMEEQQSEEATAFMGDVKAGNLAAVRRYQGDVDKPRLEDDYRCSEPAVVVAAKEGHGELLRHLVAERGANLYEAASWPESKATAVHAAVQHDQVGTLKLLIEELGADPHHKIEATIDEDDEDADDEDVEGWKESENLLDLAESGTEVMRYLIRNGIGPNPTAKTEGVECTQFNPPQPLFCKYYEVPEEEEESMFTKLAKDCWECGVELDCCAPCTLCSNSAVLVADHGFPLLSIHYNDRDKIAVPNVAGGYLSPNYFQWVHFTGFGLKDTEGDPSALNKFAHQVSRSEM